MKSLAENIIAYNESLHYKGDLPAGISIMNPYAENPRALEVSSLFYLKYYDDHDKRRLILGINPGRHGAGVTGIPFTDTKRLEQYCGLQVDGLDTYEPSSVFVYDFINAWGGPLAFYKQYYINSVCPLGFVIEDERGRVKNYNYYDSRDLEAAVRTFIIDNLNQLIELGMSRDKVYVLGSGKNYKFLHKLNKEIGLFDELVPLDHPRYVMQYKYKQKEDYVSKFVDILR